VDIIEALRERHIRAHRAAPHPTCSGKALSMSVVDLERFLDIIVPPPLSVDNDLVLRVCGRPQDLGPLDEPWQFELVPSFVEAGFEFRAIVSIPDDDLEGVTTRIAAGSAS